MMIIKRRVSRGVFLIINRKERIHNDEVVYLTFTGINLHLYYSNLKILRIVLTRIEIK